MFLGINNLILFHIFAKINCSFFQSFASNVQKILIND